MKGYYCSACIMNPIQIRYQIKLVQRRHFTEYLIKMADFCKPQSQLNRF